jgi:hypothetical protein
MLPRRASARKGRQEAATGEIVIARSEATKQSSCAQSALTKKLSAAAIAAHLLARLPARAGLLRHRRSEVTPFFERLWLAMTLSEHC